MHAFYSSRWPRFLQVSRMAPVVSMMLAIFQLPGHQVLAQALVVRHSILDDETLDSVRMCQGHAKTHGAAVNPACKACSAIAQELR